MRHDDNKHNHAHHDCHHHLFRLYVSNVPLGTVGDAEDAWTCSGCVMMIVIRSSDPGFRENPGAGRVLGSGFRKIREFKHHWPPPGFLEAPGAAGSSNPGFRENLGAPGKSGSNLLEPTFQALFATSRIARPANAGAGRVLAPDSGNSVSQGAAAQGGSH